MKQVLTLTGIAGQTQDHIEGCATEERDETAEAGYGPLTAVEVVLVPRDQVGRNVCRTQDTRGIWRPWAATRCVLRRWVASLAWRMVRSVISPSVLAPTGLQVFLSARASWFAVLLMIMGIRILPDVFVGLEPSFCSSVTRDTG